jgi:hypothetical protein
MRRTFIIPRCDPVLTGGRVVDAVGLLFCLLGAWKFRRGA